MTARRSLARRVQRVPRKVPTAPKVPETLPFARTGLYVVAGGTLFGLSAMTAWVVADASTVPADGDEPIEEACCSCGDRVKIFGSLSSTYDETVGRDEVVMGMTLLRWWLCRQASGQVLEVAAGTGPNLGWYDFNKCTSVVATDASRDMLLTAARKVEKGKNGDKIKLRHLAISAFPESFTAQFDTVVESFGLCSFEDPHKALAEIERCCAPGGTILLLEHGRSNYDIVNRHLDKYAKRHLERWGCNWNRDIESIVRKSPGIEIDSLRRFHFGTTYLIRATKKP